MIDIPEKQRRHKWVTEALKSGETMLSIWPSPDEITDKRKQEKFLEVVAKVGNDPRVTKVEKLPHEEHQWIFLFHLSDG